MLNPNIKFTYKDYLLLPEGDRWELIDGDFYVVPSPSVRHQKISTIIGNALVNYVTANALGEIFWAPLDVVFDDKNVVQPDIMFISNERRGIITEANISGGPDIVIEILSPSTADRDRELKLRLYARNGVTEYWIVDPDEKSVLVMELGEEGYSAIRSYTSGHVSSSVLSGFGIAVDEIFTGY